MYLTLVRMSIYILTVWLSVWSGSAVEPFSPDLRITTYRLKKECELKYSRNSLRSQDVRPFIGSDGRKLYFIASIGPKEAPWEAVFTAGSYGPPKRLTNNARNELAVVPSPHGDKLLLLVEPEKGPFMLVVADTEGNDLVKIANYINPKFSQFAWSSDGKLVYYTVPDQTGRTESLMWMDVDGRKADSLITQGVIDFDVCRKGHRLAAIAWDKLLIFDNGVVSRTLLLKGKPQDIRLSYDGNIAAISYGKRIIVYNIDKRKVVATSSPPEDEWIIDRLPAWSPDGKRIVFQREFYHKSTRNLIVETALVFLDIENGVEEEQKRRDVVLNRIQWSSLGDLIVFEELPIDSIGIQPLHAFTAPELKSTPEGAKWKRTNGPYGGSLLRSYAVASSNDKVLYAALSQRGVYKTTDGGENWELVETKDSIYANSVNALAVDCNNPRTVYAGTSNTIRYSANAGLSWNHYSGNTNRYRIDRLVPHPNKSGILFALCDGNRRVLLIEKGRCTELIKLDEHVTAEKLVVDRHNPELLAVYDRTQLITFSSDGGKTWHKTKPPEGEKGIMFLAGNKDQNDLLLAQARSRSVYFSMDNGINWELYADPSNPALWTKTIRETVTETFPLLIRGEKEDIVKGSSFIRLGPRNSRSLYKKIEGKLHRSDDGERTWNLANKGLGYATINSVQPLQDIPEGVMISSYPIMISRAGGENWKKIKLVHPWEIEFTAHPYKPNIVFAFDKHVSLFRSSDYGENWDPILQKDDDKEENRTAVLGEMNKGTGRKFVFNPNNPDHITLYTAGGILESFDGGLKWKKVAQFAWPGKITWPQRWRIIGNKEAITIGRRGKRSIFQTRDRGKTWLRLDGPFRGHRLVGLLGRLDTPGAVYVLTNETNCAVLWVSKDYGDTWEARPLPVIEGYAYSLASNPLNPNMLAVGIAGEVWLSRDDGKSWQNLGRCTKTGNRPITMMAFSPADNRLYAVLLKTGLFWMELPEAE